MSHEQNIRRLLQVDRTLATVRRQPAARIQRPGKDIPPPKPSRGNRPPARPEPPTTKPGMRLKQLFDAAKKNWPDRFDNAKRDKVTVVRLGSTTKSPNILYAETLTFNGTKKIPEIRKHKQYVRKRALARNDPNLLLPFSRAVVQVSCECDDFKFTFEYALAEHDAAKLTYSNAEFPIVKNPRLLLGGCKHCLVVWHAIMKRKM